METKPLAYVLISAIAVFPVLAFGQTQSSLSQQGQAPSQTQNQAGKVYQGGNASKQGAPSQTQSGILFGKQLEEKKKTNAPVMDLVPYMANSTSEDLRALVPKQYPHNTQYPRFITGFSQDENVKLARDFLEGCQEAINISSYEMTNVEFGQILMKKRKQGYQVSLIIDANEQAKQQKWYSGLQRNGLFIRLANNNETFNQNYMTCGRNHVLNGSYYYRTITMPSMGNVNAIYKQPEIAEKYVVEFETLWRRLQDLQ